MTTYNLTVDVHDLEPTGPVPPSAEVRIWRALPDASGPQVVSVKQKTYPAGTGPVVVTLTVGVAYWAEFTGVRGWETPFLFSGTVDTSIAERFRSGQVDPTSLQPLPSVPTIAAAYAALQAQLTAVLSGAPGNLDTFFEAATRFGVDEATVTTLQALVAGKADAASVAATYQPLLPAAAVRTTSYSTVGNEVVPVDATTAGVTITLPNAPADKTRATIKKIDASVNAVTIATSGSDVFNKAGGSVSASLTLLNQASTVQYVRATGVWLVVASDVPLSQLDGRYATLAQQLLGWGYAQSFRVASAIRDANEAITSASVVWPDGATGTFTTDTASTSFPGAIDAYHVTHVLNGTTLTVTQTAVTRDAGGAVVAQPALTVA